MGFKCIAYYGIITGRSSFLLFRLTIIYRYATEKKTISELYCVICSVIIATTAKLKTRTMRSVSQRRFPILSRHPSLLQDDTTRHCDHHHVYLFIRRSIVMSASVCVCVCLSVCLCVCLRAYLPKYTHDLYQIFCACYLSQLLGSPPAGLHNP